MSEQAAADTPPAARRSRLARALRGLLWTLLALLLLLGAGLGWLIGSESGARLALDGAARALPPFSADYRAGSLWRGLQLDALRWHDGDSRIDIEQLETRWDFGCLPQALCIRRIAAAEIRAQLPVADPQAPAEPPRDGPIELPQIALPLELRLDELELPSIAVQIGPARHEISDIRLALRTVGQRLELIELAAGYADNRVSASGTLGLSGDFPLDLQLRAEAPTLLPAPQRIDLQLGGNLARTELAAQLSGAFELALAGSLQPLQATLPLQLRADWQRLQWPPGGEAQVSVAAGQLTASGDLNGIDTRLDTRLQAAGQPPLGVSLHARANARKTDLHSLRLALLGGALELRGSAEYGDDIAWDISGEFSDLDPGQLAPAAAGRLSGELATRGGLAGGDWYLHDSQLRVDGRIDSEALQLPLALDLRVARAAGEPLALQALQLDALGGRLALRGDVALPDAASAELGWDISGEFSDIDPGLLAPAAPGRLHGELALRGGVAEDWRLELARLDLHGLLRELPLRLALRAQRPAGAPLALQQLRLEALDGQLEVSGEVALAPPPPLSLGWDMAGQFSAINPGRLTPELPGELGGDFAVRGGLTADGDWQLALAEARVDGQLRDYPLRLDSQLSRQPGDLWDIARLRLDSGRNHIAASGRLDEHWALGGRIELPALDELLPDARGRLAAEFALSGPRLEPSLQLSATGADIEAAGAALEALELRADIRQLLLDDSELTLRASGLRQGEQDFGELNLALSGDRAEHRLSVDLSGGSLNEGELALSAQLRGALRLPAAAAEAVDGAATAADGLRWRGELSAARLAAVGQDWSLVDAVPIEWSGATRLASVGAHCWRQDEARLCLREPTSAGASGAAKLRLSDLPLATLGALMPAQGKLQSELQGELGAEIDASWAPDRSPRLDLDLAVDGGGVLLRDEESAAEPLHFVYRSLRVQAQMDRQRVSANIALDSEDLGRARVDLQMDPQRAGYPLDGRLRLDGLDIGVARAFAPQLNELAGQIEVDGRLSGRLAQPVFVGTVGLGGLRVAGAQLPLQVTGGGIEARLDGPRAQISGRIETDGGGIDITGEAQWAGVEAGEATPWGLSARISGENLQIAQKPTVEATLSPDIRLSLAPQRLELHGEVDIPRARVTVRELPESVTTLSDDAVVIRAEAQEPQPAAQRWRNDVHIAVQLGDDVRLEGFDLRANLAGNIEIQQQSPNPPQLEGDIDISEGIYKAYGQDLRIRRGQVLLLGPIQSTAVDVEAVRTSGDQVAGLRVTGNINRPTVELFAEPAQTEEDTLSWILLGRPLYGADGGEPDQAGMLAKAAVALGIKGGRGIATGIAEAFGIRDFEIDTASRGDDTEVVLSGRISEDLYLRYGVGVLTPVNTVTLRYNLTEKLYVETAQGVESALDFFYSFDF